MRPPQTGSSNYSDLQLGHLLSSPYTVNNPKNGFNDTGKTGQFGKTGNGGTNTDISLNSPQILFKRYASSKQSADEFSNNVSKNVQESAYDAINLQSTRNHDFDQNGAKKKLIE